MTAATPDELLRMGAAVQHHFGGGAYVKETFMKAGAALVQHQHEHAHLAYLVAGQVVLAVEGEGEREMVSPQCIELAAGKYHGVRAVTDALWLCIWPADEDANEENIDARILAR